jgi:hypothetical protein
MDAPKIVRDLAASVNGEVLRWREEDNNFVILMTDGRKFRFPKTAPEKPRRDQTPDDFKAPVDQTPDPDKHHRKTKDKE